MRAIHKERLTHDSSGDILNELTKGYAGNDERRPTPNGLFSYSFTYANIYTARYIWQLRTDQEKQDLYNGTINQHN